jgi:hypothetical protein
MNLPPMPKLSKSGARKAGNADLDRIVHWRQVGDDVWGWCARCRERKPAVELRWRPDRNLFGKEVQGSWECRECNPKAGKYDVLGTSINGK